MSLTSGEIVAIVVASVVLFVVILWLWLSWYTWRKVKRVNPDIPRVKIDPQEYRGRWYEVARYPQWFEKGCSDVTATYTPTDDGIKVENKCYRNNDWSISEGWAYPAGPEGILGVSFFPGVYGQYMVTYRDPDTSIVTNADRTSLWVLSRKPSITRSKRKKLLQWLQHESFDTKPLEFTAQCTSTPC